MVESGWDTLNKQRPESDVDIMNLFFDGETRLNVSYKIIEDKETGEKRIEIIPTAYPELNTRDLKIGNIDSPLENQAVNANLRAAQSVKYLAEKTNNDYRKAYNFVFAASLRRLGLSLSKNGTLLKEMRGRRLTEEGTQHIMEQSVNPPKKFLGLF